MLRVILLPGMDGTGQLFSPFIAALSGLFEVQVVSYPPKLASYAALTDLVAQALPKNEPYLLLGESFSGPIAVDVAASHPPGLKGLVLCATFVRNPSALLRWLGPALRLLPPLQPPAMLMRWLLSNGSARSGSEVQTLRRLLQSALSPIPPATLLARLREVQSVDVSRKLAAVNVPILYLQARHDRLVPSGAFDDMQNVHPRVQRVTFDAPHLLLQTMPTAAADALIRFTACLEQPRTAPHNGPEHCPCSQSPGAH
jgi:pimeloyl-ACP methyl ester carboxylesterase